MNYKDLYGQSIHQKEIFWEHQTAQLNWRVKPSQILASNEKGLFQWFCDGRLNISELCLDVHVAAGRGQQIALIYDSPVSNQIQKFTYGELLQMVAKFAGGLCDLGIKKGDTIVIYMPMIPQAVVAMLACARIGAIHSVVFGGFAAHELALRIDDAKPKAIITASFGIEVDKIIPYEPLVNMAILESIYKPESIIMYNRDKFGSIQNTYIDFDKLLQNSRAADAVPVESNHPLYILYTSGTTGKPKGIVRDTGAYATALHFSMKYFYGARPDDVFWAASDVGWVVGHSYIVYGPLLGACTTILYDGKPVKTPDCGSFWRVVTEHKVSIMFTAPTALRAIKKEDDAGLVLGQYDLSSLRALFLAGERLDSTTYEWIKNMLNVPVIDHWWQTESGWPMLGIMLGTELISAKSGSAGLPVCGFDVHILNEAGDELEPGKEGFVAVKLPLPPGCLLNIWQDTNRFTKEYLSHFEGYYLTGDGGYKDADGYFYITGRIDDVINVSGHRLSTGEMEELIASHPAVAECAVVGINDALRGQRPVGFVVLKDSVQILEEELEMALVSLIRDKIGAIAFFKTAVVVKRLPKTRSGKILRKIIRSIADASPFQVPSTIENPDSLDELEKRLRQKNLL